MPVPDLALLRLAAQRLVGTDCDTPADAVRTLTALQAQDHPGAVTSIALRTRNRSRAAVEAALTSGEVVKSWPMRGTLHFVPAEDLPWMLELMAPRVITGAAPRRSRLELDEATLERARELAIEALTGGRELSRSALLACWEQAGLATTGQRGYHLIWHLAQTGTFCFGPVRAGEQQLVLIEDWIPKPRSLEPEEALGELARRYFRGHGPASVKDFARWTKLRASQVRTAVALARPELEALTRNDVEYLMDPLTSDRLAGCLEQARGVLLLPGFDEYMLGYGDREAALPAPFSGRIVPGGNGMFRSTVIAGGQVVGTWIRFGRGGRRGVLATPFTTFSPEVEAAVPDLFDALP